MPSKPFRNVNLCGGNGWFGEETLDVEAVHAMATDANVMYYAARSCTDTDFLDVAAADRRRQQGVDRDQLVGRPRQNTTSGTIVAYEQIFQQGAMQGIGFMFSSGDDGDELLASGAFRPTSRPATRG